MQKIKSGDISVVVQGPNVKRHTAKCLKSLRKNFPGAEIIFSTYENENVSGLDFDVLVTSVDPKATLLSGNMYNNINRILTTTNAGLEKVSRKYCLKIRSDMFFDNDKILFDIGAKFPHREQEYKVFKQRVLFYSLWSRKFEYLDNKYYLQTPFYLSDWMCFGLTEDIKAYFTDIPLTQEPQYTHFFKNAKNRKQKIFDPNVTWRFSPEQYFATTFFGNFFEKARMNSLQDIKPEQMDFSRRVFASNVVVCGYKECGAYIQKKQYRFVSKSINILRNNWLNGVYRYSDFLFDYKKYCDSRLDIPFYYVWMQNRQVEYFIEKIDKHLKSFLTPLLTLCKWMENLFSVCWYFVKLFYITAKIYIKFLKQK